MIILAIDTSLDDCIVAIAQDGEILASSCQKTKSKQAEILPQMVKEICEKAKINPKQIDKIGVTIGPGSFTGVRVGLAFAKGLAIATDAQIIGISTLELLAQSSSNSKTIALIEQMGSVFAASFINGEMIDAPNRFENFDFIKNYESDWSIIGFKKPTELENHNFIIKETFDIDSFIKLCTQKDIQKNPPIPQYLRGADAKLWQGSQYV
ncbi:MAG: tRNA (adenosine(37)-N6)-threonylcarbamoyltransferase complex dimerization subunit type 1 TsaB [Caulobacterales bacterium]|nr:tRNA (adenosine(37)-N6)-threonylcarbamoyltransferase complex dimerization subunit type 1 TsaB [Caulobacterales bacterium]MCA0371966.1 tRNA (adenosine(37)-N6)-threonylcarbamoyltransferase complex dimerization subunit type 1 TsaB [Pseudomonadota bacterium]